MQIKSKNDVSMLKIQRFLGLNENPDGDAALGNGEFSEMRNFKITQDRHLQIRPGCKTVLRLREAWEAAGGETYYGVSAPQFCGVWQGFVNPSSSGSGVRTTVASFGGGLFSLDLSAGTAAPIGRCSQAEASFFGFGGKVYLLNGRDYMGWDGDPNGGFAAVEGYVPLVWTGMTPSGSGTALEQINLLTPKRRARYNTDGTSTVFQLPEGEITAVHAVTLYGEAAGSYIADLRQGTVAFASAPAAGMDALEITWSKGEGSRGTVCAMRFSELYNGATDTRVFLYGDGSCRAVYSGVPYDAGKPSAEYFPMYYELRVGDENTPLTALVRHYSRLMAFKPDSAWSIQYGSMTLDDGTLTASFYIQPVNRQFGHVAPGQVRLLENDPLTIDVGAVHQWSSGAWNGYYSGSENNVKRVSDRVMKTLGSFDLAGVRTVNLKSEHEFWILDGSGDGGRALIFNYANDCWYFYDALPFRDLLESESETAVKLYGFDQNGQAVHFSREYRSDDGENIVCRASTGAMDFERDWLLKYSPMVFVSMQPESGARLYVTVETNRRSDYPHKLVAYGLATFAHVDFAHWSFGVNRKPQVRRVKLKVKKATYYRLVFFSDSASATATVVETDVKLRYAGNVK